MNHPEELDGVVGAVDIDDVELRKESQDIRLLVRLVEDDADDGDEGERLHVAQSSEVKRRLGL